MRRRGALVVLLLWAMSAVGLARAAPADVDDTDDDGDGNAVVIAQSEAFNEIQSIFVSGDLDKTLELIQAVLKQRAKIEGGLLYLPENKGIISLAELHTIRGQALLGKGDLAGAKAAFRVAAEQATAKTPAPLSVRALQLLIAESRGTGYSPRRPPGQPPAEPIDIVKPDSRIRALKALWTDQSDALHAKIDRAVEARKVKQMTDLIGPLLDLRALELTASEGEGAARADGMIESLTERIAGLFETEVERKGRRVDELLELASELVEDEDIFGRVTDYHRRGLWSRERTELKQIAQDLNDVNKASTRIATQLREGGVQSGAFSKVITKSNGFIRDAIAEIDRSDGTRGGEQKPTGSRQQ
jgi:hypothetical protein